MRTLMLPVALSVALFGGAVSAQPVRSPTDAPITFEQMRERAHARFARADATRDGRLTAEERQATRTERMTRRLERRLGPDGALTRDEFRRRADQRFARLDRDRDGRLTAGEIRPSGRMGARRQGGRMERLAGREITLAELDARLRRRFDRRDLDGNGVLSADERGRPAFRRDRLGE